MVCIASQNSGSITHFNMKRLCCILLYILVHLQDSPVVDCRRTRHSKRRSEKITLDKHSSLITQSSHLGSKLTACDIKLPNKCNCTNHSGSLSITCDQAGLQEVPILKPGPSVVKSLSLKQNRITSIKIGAFFGVKIESLLLSNNSIASLEFLAFWGLEFKLDTLDLSYNLFEQVPFASLRLLRNLHILNLNGNRITSLRDFDFGYLRKLEVLALDNNPITVIAADTFYGTQLSLLNLSSIDLRAGLNSFPSTKLKLLKGLSLANNRIQDLPARWFDNMKHLKYLCLDDNILSQIPAESFMGVSESLETLELNSNSFEEIPSDILRNIPNLKKFAINDNIISKIHPHDFNMSSNIEVLDLSNNLISAVSIRGFYGLDSVQKIDLRDNELTGLDDRTIYWEETAGREILMAYNPYLCNCLLKWFKRQFRRKTDVSRMFTDAKSMICERPYQLEGMQVIRVRQKDFHCNHDYYYYYTVNEDGTKSQDDMLNNMDGDIFDSYDVKEDYHNYYDSSDDYADFGEDTNWMAGIYG